MNNICVWNCYGSNGSTMDISKQNLLWKLDNGLCVSLA